jgi:hypothetical protein
MSSNLAAFRVERRRISVAVFVDERLDYTGSHQLSSHYLKALASSSRYVDWISRSFRVEGVALEKSRPDLRTWKGRTTKEIVSQLRDSGIPIFEIDKDVLLASFGHPPLRYRTELRKVVSSIWPVLATKNNSVAVLDAAALGLYVQVEKIFAV